MKRVVFVWVWLSIAIMAFAQRGFIARPVRPVMEMRDFNRVMKNIEDFERFRYRSINEWLEQQRLDKRVYYFPLNDSINSISRSMVNFSNEQVNQTDVYDDVYYFLKNDDDQSRSINNYSDEQTDQSGFDDKTLVILILLVMAISSVLIYLAIVLKD